MKRVLITGANGLLGQKLIDLGRKDASLEVHGTGRGTDRNIPGNHTYHSLDLTDQASVNELIQDVRPDVVIHTAAMTQVDECEERPEECKLQNVEVVRYLAKACSNVGAFLVHTSTDFIFDGKSGPYREDHEPNPLSVYGQSKLDSENLLKDIPGLSYGIARTILVYGRVNQMSRSNIVLWLKTALENGKEIKLVTDQFRSPTLAEDLAMGCWLIGQKRAEGVFNISGPDIVTPYEIGLATAKVFGLSTDLIGEADSSSFTQKAKRPPKTGFILDKAKQELGYQPRSLVEGLNLLKSQLT